MSKVEEVEEIVDKKAKEAVEKQLQNKEMELRAQQRHVERLREEMQEVDPNQEKSVYEEYQRVIGKESGIERRILGEKQGLIDQKEKLTEITDDARRDLFSKKKDIELELRKNKVEIESISIEIDEFHYEYEKDANGNEDKNRIKNGNDFGELLQKREKLFNQKSDLEKAKDLCDYYIEESNKQWDKKAQRINEILRREKTEKETIETPEDEPENKPVNNDTKSSEKKPVETSTKKPENNPVEPFMGKTEKKPVEPSINKPEKPSVKIPVRGTSTELYSKPVEPSTNKPENKPAEEPMNKPENQPENNPVENLMNEPENQPVENPANEVEDKPEEDVSKADRIIIGRDGKVTFEGKDYSIPKSSVRRGVHLVDCYHRRGEGWLKGYLTRKINPKQIEELLELEQSENSYETQRIKRMQKTINCNNFIKEIMNYVQDGLMDITVIEGLYSTEMENKDKTNFMLKYLKTARDIKEGKETSENDRVEITYDMDDLSKINIFSRFMKNEVNEQDKQVIIAAAEKGKEMGISKTKGEYKYSWLARFMNLKTTLKNLLISPAPVKEDEEKQTENKNKKTKAQAFREKMNQKSSKETQKKPEKKTTNPKEFSEVLNETIEEDEELTQ